MNSGGWTSIFQLFRCSKQYQVSVPCPYHATHLIRCKSTKWEFGRQPRLIRFSLHPLGNSSDNHTRIEPRINCRPERLHPNQPWPLSRRDSQWRPPLLYLAHCTGSQPHLLLPRGPRAVQWWDENPVMINRSTPMKDPRTVGPRPPPTTSS